MQRIGRWGSVAIDATIDGNDRLYQLLKKKARSGIKHLLPLGKEL